MVPWAAALRSVFQQNGDKVTTTCARSARVQASVSQCFAWGLTTVACVCIALSFNAVLVVT